MLKFNEHNMLHLVVLVAVNFVKEMLVSLAIARCLVPLWPVILLIKLDDLHIQVSRSIAASVC